MEWLLIIIVVLLIYTLIQLNTISKEKNTTQKELEALRNSIATTMYQQTTTLDSKLSKTTEHLVDVHKTLAEVKESNKHIQELGKNMSSLGDILRSPKLRGNLGEFLLNEALSNYFHKDHYTLQYTFPSGDRVDACIHLHGGKHLCIDAKFPLENFKKMLETEEHGETYHKAFIRDVKKHVDTIHAKYIQPAAGTLDFALMYIPAENVYYELIAKESSQDLLKYCFEKQVIPVSPTTLFSYIQILLLGFQGLQVEERAREILTRLAQLQKYLKGFEEEYLLLGKHIGNAKNVYDGGTRSLSRVQGFAVLEEPKE